MANFNHWKYNVSIIFFFEKPGKYGIIWRWKPEGYSHFEIQNWKGKSVVEIWVEGYLQKMAEYQCSHINELNVERMWKIWERTDYTKSQEEIP